MKKWFKQRISDINPLIEKYIDGAYSFFLLLFLLLDWFSIRNDMQIPIICIMMELYALYYCEKKLNKWAMLNLMLAFYRIAKFF